MTSALARPSRLDAARLQAAVRAADWEHVEADTRYLTHDLHRYSGKFIPPIARAAIELLSEPGELVVDPFAGSGTTILEAGLRERRALGIDLNPLAVSIATAKTTNVSADRLRELEDDLLAVADAVSDERRMTLAPPTPSAWLDAVERDPRLRDPWFVKWFDTAVLRDLLLIDVAIATLPHPQQRTLAEVALSNVLRRSSRAHSGYPNVMFDRRAPDRPRPGRAFAMSLRRCVAMVSQLPSLAGLTVARGDARQLPLADGAADAIVTHPPYIGSVPYAEYGLVSLKWRGEDPRALDGQLTGGRRQSRDVVERFESAYDDALRESWRVLKTGGGMFVMVGRPVVRGATVDLPAMTCRLAGDASFELLASTERVGTNRRANKMGAEALLFFAKP